MSIPQKVGGDVTMGRMDTRSLVIFLVIGLVAGFLASLVVGGGGLITYLISGVIGAFVGGWLFSALKINLQSQSASRPDPDVDCGRHHRRYYCPVDCRLGILQWSH